MTPIALAPSCLPDGRYTLRILRVKEHTSRARHPILHIVFEVSCGPHAGYRFACAYSLLPQALWKLRRLCLAAGCLPDNDLLDPKSLILLSLESNVTKHLLPGLPPLYQLDDEKPLPDPLHDHETHRASA